MKQEWQDFLQNAGAEIEGQRVCSFGNPAREQRVLHTGLILCDLSHLGLIAVYGDDAETFLQGQLTNDIHHVDTEHSQLSAYCTPKGRMLSNFRIFKRQETFYLQLPSSQLESTLKRIQMFVLMSKVTIKDASDALVRFGLSGPDAEEKLGEIISKLPKQVDEVTQAEAYTIVRIAGPHPRYEIYGELEAMTQLWSSLDVNAAPVGADSWSTLDILSGIPTIYPETAEAFVPQMTNMQAINGVSFKKGCYTGQEVVARMQYLGKLKRRMYRIHIDSHEAVKPGDKLYSASSTSGQGTGNIVAAQIDPDGGTMALAVIDINTADQGELTLYDENGPAIRLMELPYSIDNE